MYVNYRLMKKVLALISFFAVVVTQAQQFQCTVNTSLTILSLIQPYGSKSYYPLQINSRNQWSGLGDISPKTNILSYHMPIAYDAVGVGAVIAQDQTGPYSHYSNNIFCIPLQLMIKT